MIILTLFTLLILKHFIIDFPAQTPYQWMNKGTYGHPGGILHAGLHGIGTFAAFALYVVTPWAIILGILDMVIHYHVDWLKMNINKKYGWKADTHPEFWIALGLDQLAHYLTYCFLIWLIL
jgi:hypothetical protein